MAHKARKRFGQNFLVDQQIINQIVSTISPKKNDNIIEIGPGKGALTFPLIDYLESIHVIEIDRDLIALLQKKNNIKIKKMITVKKFGAVWCGPCRALGPVLEGLKNDFAGKATFIEYDVDNSPEESQQYNVTSIPVVIIERDGVVIQRFQGLSSKMAYTNAINEAIG